MDRVGHVVLRLVKKQRAVRPVTGEEITSGIVCIHILLIDILRILIELLVDILAILGIDRTGRRLCHILDHRIHNLVNVLDRCLGRIHPGRRILDIALELLNLGERRSVLKCSHGDSRIIRRTLYLLLRVVLLQVFIVCDLIFLHIQHGIRTHHSVRYSHRLSPFKLRNLKLPCR